MHSYAAYLAHDEGYFARCGCGGGGDDDDDDDDGDDDDEPGVVGGALKCALETVGFTGEDAPADAEAGAATLSTPLLGDVATANPMAVRSMVGADDDGAAPPCEAPVEARAVGGRAPSASNDSKEASDRAARRRAKPSIVVVAVLGSLDDFTVYFALAASGRFTWYELCVGTVCGCAVLALVVAALTGHARVAEAVQKIPVPLVLGVLAVLIAASAFFPSIPV